MLDVGKTELANLLGFNYYSQMTQNIGIGDTLDIVKASDAARFLRTLDQEKIKRIKEQFATISGQFDDMSDLVNSMTLLDTIKNA